MRPNRLAALAVLGTTPRTCFERPVSASAWAYKRRPQALQQCCSDSVYFGAACVGMVAGKTRQHIQYIELPATGGDIRMRYMTMHPHTQGNRIL